MTEHDFITEDGIEILIKAIDEDRGVFTILSSSPEFIDIFGRDNLEITGDGSNLEDLVLSEVPHRYQDKALKIVREIRNVI